MVLEDIVEKELLTASKDEMIRAVNLIQNRIKEIELEEDREEERNFISDRFDDEEEEESDEADED